MIVNLSIKYCESMKDYSDFLLFGVEVTTVYSSSIVAKRFEDFERLHKELAYFWNSQQKSVKLIELLPTLPRFSSDSPEMKKKLNKYSQSLLKILQNPLFNKFHPWIKIIGKFFKVREIEKVEEKKAIFIQNSFKQFCAKKATKKKVSISSLSISVLQGILIFLHPCELKIIKSVSQKLKTLAKQVQLFSYFKEKHEKCENKKRVDFSYSLLPTNQIIQNIFTQCKPDKLQFLSLANCPIVSDSSLLFLQHLDPNQNYVLSHLNLSKCKITDTAIPHLKIFAKLNELDLQECLISDDSIIKLPKLFPHLSTLNLSGTEITNIGLNIISASHIENLIVSNCKNINFSDIRKSRINKIITACEEFVIILTHELTKQSILIQGRKEIQVKDICNFLRKKLGSSQDICVKHNGKALKLYENLINIPQENCSVVLNFSFVHKEWPGLPEWLNKKHIEKCAQCQMKFSWYNLKINCRLCGKVFCSKCAKTKIFIEKFGYTISKVPICLNCSKSKLIS